jgi:hypothetical protein
MEMIREGRACSNVREILETAEKKGLNDKEIGLLAQCSTVSIRRWRESGRGDYNHVSLLFTALQGGDSNITGTLLADASIEDLTARAWELGFEASFRYTGKPIVASRNIVPSSPARQGTAKFMFQGEEYGQGRLVMAVINHIVEQHNCDYKTLTEYFPDRLQGSLGVVARLSDIRDHSRYFMKEDEIVTLSDGEQVAVCNQWGMGASPNTPQFIEQARELGCSIEQLT